MFLGLLLLASPPVRSQEPDPAVHAVLFFSPTCPHCHEVINTFLIPLQNEFGSRLVILGMNTSQSWANALFWDALRHYEVPEEQWAVPFMIVEDTVLIGADEISEEFRTILEEGLESGGIDLPSFPSLLTFMEDQGMLDDRYPDRRIARQAPQEAETETPPPPEEMPTEEVPTQTVDSMAEPAAELPDPEAVPPDEEPQGEVMESPDTLASPDPVADSLPVAPPEAEVPTPTEDPAQAEVATPAEDSPQAEVVPTPEVGVEMGATPPPTSPETTPEAPPETTPGGALDLATAAREMESMTWRDRFNQDPMGNTLAVVVLLLMIVSLVLRGRPSQVEAGVWPDWVIPALIAVGVGVAGYLSYIEVTQVEAVCGPVGDCNTVNQSPYATLFGFLPVGILGLMGYGVILLLWGVGRMGPVSLRGRAHLGLWAAVLFGTLFSVYLTFLEPFVIGATCAWCLTSAANMTVLLWAVAPLAADAWPGRSG